MPFDHFFDRLVFVNTHFHNIFISERRAHKREIGDEVLSPIRVEYAQPNGAINRIGEK
jgi:hypothetical protein